MKSNLISFLFIGTVFILGFGAFKLWTWFEETIDLPYYGKNKTFAPNFRQAMDKSFKKTGSFSFIDQDSQALNRSQLEGKVWVADYFFTRCPTVCPKMTNNLQLLQEAFGQRDDVRVLSFTCDPAYDRPAQLRRYAAAFDAVPNFWFFVTGEKEILYRFARKELYLTATEGNGSETDFIHEQYLVLIDKKGYIRGYYDGTNEYEVKILINDIKKIL